MPDILLPCGALTAALCIGFGGACWFIHRSYIVPLEHRLFRLERRLQQLSAPPLPQPRPRYRTIVVEDPEEYEYS